MVYYEFNYQLFNRSRRHRSQWRLIPYNIYLKTRRVIHIFKNMIQICCRYLVLKVARSHWSNSLETLQIRFDRKLSVKQSICQGWYGSMNTDTKSATSPGYTLLGAHAACWSHLWLENCREWWQENSNGFSCYNQNDQKWRYKDVSISKQYIQFTSF